MDSILTQKRQWILALAFMLVPAWTTGAQTAPTAAPSKAVRPIGVVQVIDLTAKHILLQTDAGTDMVVWFDEKTAFLRVAPGERDLRSAAKIEATEVKSGDRVLARGRVAEDEKSMTAVSVIVMTKSDIETKRTAERADWEKRGAGGIVSEVKPDAGEVTITSHSLGGSKKVVITLAKDAVVRRYAPDSVKFSDAKASRIEEIKAGDQVRARGIKSEDGTRITAEELVSGSFLIIAATVESVNPTENTAQVLDLTSKKKILVHVNKDSNLRQIPIFLARMLAARSAGGAGAQGGPTMGQRPPSLRGDAPAGDRPQMSGGPGRAMGDRPRDLQSMMDRMPAITLADLKPGEAIAVASTRGADPAQITAITLLSGIEPLLTTASNGDRQVNGSWNLNLNVNMGMDVQ